MRRLAGMSVVCLAFALSAGATPAAAQEPATGQATTSTPQDPAPEPVPAAAVVGSAVAADGWYAHADAAGDPEFSIEGDPEAGTVRFLDRFGRPIAPPGLHPPGDGPPARPGDRPPDGGPSPYTPPLAERLGSDSFTWN